jgi:hypothetical protein
MKYIYVCVTRYCRRKDKEWSSTMGPREHRFATGAPVRCKNCGGVVVLRRMVQDATEEPMK